ncbi:aminoglycoside phosphotransferase family protein [Alkalihalobacillus macyae]|uniref:phosphotransferase family protein n=1 Tax=Guptibacillus hwajinpoensis TaxID=208199 RepID=UPI00273B2F14|nr:aminoglycoside phosphotransferase family protein [Alkalihalobacillus macyae]MDP4552308.1 aminoglycoside phosphotransferase family protein [Alkalihalobacillus macyae]
MSFEIGLTLTTALKKARNQHEKCTLIKSFGKLVCGLHETNPVGSLHSEKDWICEQLSKAERYLESGNTDGDLELLQKLKLNLPSRVQQTMIHGDCTTDNVMVLDGDGEVRLFIDVAGMTIGDPRYDESLAIRKWINNEEYITAFYEGYIRYRVTKQEFEYFKEGLYEFF